MECSVATSVEGEATDQTTVKDAVFIGRDLCHTVGVACELITKAPCYYHQQTRVWSVITLC